MILVTTNRTTDDLPKADTNETKQFWSKKGKLKEHNRKATWINKVKKEVAWLEEGPKSAIQLESPRAMLKKKKKSTELENAWHT